jgi:hypothetical protein
MEIKGAVMPEIKFYEKPRSLGRMLRDVKDTIKYPMIIKTAAKKGWFSNGVIITCLTEEEHTAFKKKFDQHLAFRDAEDLSVKSLLRRTEGPELLVVESYPESTTYPFYPPLTKLATRYDDIVYVNTWAYLTLCQRHPEATPKMTGWYKSEDDPIIFVKKGYISGMMMPFNIL